MKFIGTLLVGLASLIACGVGRLLPSPLTSSGTTQSATCVEPQQVVTRRIEFITESANSLDNPQPSIATTSNDNREVDSEALVTLKRKVDLLEKGGEFLAGVDSYCAKLAKQEVVGPELLDEQTIQLKCRHKPFSVYLVWLTGDTGREVLYVEGQNNGKMVAHDGGWKARLPAFNLDPNCRLAMRDTRYPVTDAGLATLTNVMLDLHREDLVKNHLASCTVEDDQSFDGRPCTVFTTVYGSPTSSSIYRKSITYIDNEWNLPVHSKHFEWPAADKKVDEANLDDSTLVESYSFTEVKMSSSLTDSDFDRDNSEYRFR
ncbi:MAG: hypothetical protein JWP89_3932 [Schlesneria sp.]|nr:hypothetical protein [Schlesneria sp.]